MSISTDWGYNESDLPSKFRNVPLSVKAAMTAFGRSLGSRSSTPTSVWFNGVLGRENVVVTFASSSPGVSLNFSQIVSER